LLLLSHGADVNAVDKDGRTPLHYAAEGGCAEAVKKLLELGADVYAIDSRGQTALHYAVKSLNKDVVELVLHAGVNAKDAHGETPLHLALKECARWDAEKEQCYKVVKTLIEHGADVGARNAKGRTPLDIAKLIESELIDLLSKK